MRFSVVGLVAASALAVNGDDDSVYDSAAATRQAGASAVASGLGGAAIDVATGVAVNTMTDILRAVIEWTKARETFTQAMTDEMWAQNPEPGMYHAAICSNEGYDVRDRNGIGGLDKVTLRLKVLHTDYDCLCMAGPDQFWTEDEGGYINLSYTYDRNHCSSDGKTGDLTCR